MDAFLFSKILTKKSGFEVPKITIPFRQFPLGFPVAPMPGNANTASRSAWGFHEPRWVGFVGSTDGIFTNGTCGAK